MANVLVEETSLEDIADAIRSKNGLTTKYKPAEMADAISAISGGGISPTGTKQINITQNGTVTEDVTNYASAEITANVPNSYSASDEGKVVSNGALVAQTSQNITANGTYDTTTKNSVNVAVPQGITPSGSQTFTENGTYDVTSLAQAVVNVEGSGGSTPIRGIDHVEFVANDPNAEAVVINMPDLTEIAIDSVSSSGGTSYLKTVDITSEKTISFNNNSSNNYRVRIVTLDLHGGLLNLTGNYGMRYMDRLTTVNARINTVLPSTLNNQFFNDNVLETIYFVENLQTNSIAIDTAPLSEASLISLANGLNEGVSDKTLNVSSTRVTMCGQITGNSVEVTVDETTYHRFVADDNGSMTLTEFITTVKGWTLA